MPPATRYARSGEVGIAYRELGEGEVLASRTVRDLAVGSGIDFEPHGRHALKGVPEEWEVFAVATTPLSGNLAG
jgi:class 3 adenylate cyclase